MLVRQSTYQFHLYSIPLLQITLNMVKSLLHEGHFSSMWQNQVYSLSLLHKRFGSNSELDQQYGIKAKKRRYVIQRPTNSPYILHSKSKTVIWRCSDGELGRIPGVASSGLVSRMRLFPCFHAAVSPVIMD